MSWVVLIMAGLFEVVGVIGLNLILKDRSVRSFSIMFLGFLISFSLLKIALFSLPMGLAYAVWTGIGTVGGTLVGMYVYGEKKDWRRILFMVIIISSIIGLKITS